MTLTVTLVGGPTALIEYAGLRILTDPAFSRAGDYGYLTKTSGPAIAADAVGAIDVVLLSHDHHADNLDPAGRELLPAARHMLTTVAGAERLGGGATGLAPWASAEVTSAGGASAVVTAVPALHGPVGSEPVTGPVIGFVIEAEGAERVYVSGDNASLNVVREVAEAAGPFDVALLFAGAAQLAQRFDGADLTMSSENAAAAARILGVRAAVPVHFEGWAHFTQDAGTLRDAFAQAGLADRLVLLAPGESADV